MLVVMRMFGSRLAKCAWTVGAVQRSVGGSNNCGQGLCRLIDHTIAPGRPIQLPNPLQVRPTLGCLARSFEAFLGAVFGLGQQAVPVGQTSEQAQDCCVPIQNSFVILSSFTTPICARHDGPPSWRPWIEICCRMQIMLSHLRDAELQFCRDDIAHHPHRHTVRAQTCNSCIPLIHFAIFQADPFRLITGARGKTARNDMGSPAFNPRAGQRHRHTSSEVHLRQGRHAAEESNLRADRLC